MPFRKEKIISLLEKIVSSFVKSKVESGTIVSITGIEISNDLRKVKILISIFPENKEKETFNSLKDKEKDLRNYAKTRLKMKFLPSFEIEMDKGEKNRQRLEEILQKD